MYVGTYSFALGFAHPNPPQPATYYANPLPATPPSPSRAETDRSVLKPGGFGRFSTIIQTMPMIHTFFFFTLLLLHIL